MWTNTCCSHQLTGFEPDEVDDSVAVTSLQVLGSKHAARRKLQHELGIPPSQAWPTVIKPALLQLHPDTLPSWSSRDSPARAADIQRGRGSWALRVSSRPRRPLRALCGSPGWAQVPLEGFRFWTRLHYCAADRGPDGDPTGWGGA